MIIRIKDLLNKRDKFNNKDSENIYLLLKDIFPLIKRSNICFDKGLLRFENINSPLRCEILLKKKTLMEKISDKNIYIKDIL